MKLLGSDRRAEDAVENVCTSTILAAVVEHGQQRGEKEREKKRKKKKKSEEGENCADSTEDEYHVLFVCP